MNQRLKSIAESDARNYQPVNEVRRLVSRFENISPFLYESFLKTATARFDALERSLGQLATLDRDATDRLAESNKTYLLNHQKMKQFLTPRKPALRVEKGGLSTKNRGEDGITTWIKQKGVTLYFPLNISADERDRVSEYFQPKVPIVQQFSDLLDRALPAGRIRTTIPAR